MLRFFRSALCDFYPVLSYHPRTFLGSVLNSDSVMDPVKRKSDVIETENSSSSEAKKFKAPEEAPIDDVIKNAVESSNRVRKPKKAVILMSYLGKEFYGMQRNSNVSTVEEELLKALLKTNIILQGEFDYPKTMKFQRAARTDKGVSAVRQIVSLKLPLKEINDTFAEKVNKCLPAEIRIVAVKRVTQSFDAKIACDARTYSYMLPTFAFAKDVQENVEDYRISDEHIVDVNNFLKNYVGTHNFYNFTSGRLAGDPSCKRFIMSCECGSPFESFGLEFSVIKVKGQSFMLHQIRKMVGLAIAYMRNLADLNVLQKSWSSDRIDIPKAPGLGLMLEELHYDWYNTKYGSDGMHQSLTWGEYDEIVNSFKMEKICANIAKTEREEKSMIQWLETLPHHSYDVREDGPPTTLPAKEEAKESDSNLLNCNQNSLEDNKLDSETVLCKDLNSDIKESKENEIKCQC